MNKNLIYFCFFTFLVLIVCLFSPEFVEIIYGQWIYPSLRLVMNTLLFIFPLPLFLIFIPSTLLWFGYKLAVIWRFKNTGYKKKWKRSTAFVFKVILLVICYFYWIWGLNYLRPSYEESLELRLEAVEMERVFHLLEKWTERVNADRTILTALGYLEESDLFDHRTNYPILVEGLNNFLIKHDYPQYREVPLRHWFPPGILMRNGTAGMYFPFTGESTIDPGLHPIQIPFTAAHEIGHGVGFTDEGFCNLLALVICLNSDDPFIRYSGSLVFWRHIARAARSLDYDRYALFIDYALSEWVRADLHSIYAHRDRYPDWFSGLQRRLYHTYLRAHGVREGVASYNQLLMLAESYFELHGEGH
nr:DUF3810 family protein [Saprospiraceae bacterium]